MRIRAAVAGVFSVFAVFAAQAAPASASSPIRLYMGEGPAFSVLGHWCGGIQQQVYVRGFTAGGYPTGNVHLQTSCGGSGRDGGGHVTTYTATATVVWTWFGETRSYSKPASGPLEAAPAEDSYGDRVYNTGTAGYLETGSPPLQPPAAPGNVTASAGLYESGENEYLRLNVGWTQAPETAPLIQYSTVTATPVSSAAPVLSTSVSSYWSSAALAPAEPNTTYRITVTTTDAEGTSPPSEVVEIRTPNSDGEAEHENSNTNTCTVTGKISLTPGLTEEPHVQTVTFKGELTNCEGQAVPETGKFTDHLTTTEEVNCSTLSSASTEPTTTSTSFSVKWLPLEEGTSKGTLALPLSEVSLTEPTGSVKGGPFEETTPVTMKGLYESYTGASMCGLPQGRLNVVKPVRKGVFSGQLSFG